ncbi:Undecaprenyl phosphate-alpha-4-amino-4-deoxy-L-arabinose arabinosyl transferase [Legionella massiliensis]|uniref:Undecaprenyl phosphate-alpha-4-amino-4-deoxy-L-arabinose arabinosyl transferase n=1 Tax=Legionella massiliensis TaxID=1034943 RepID=A0A078L3D6_9GAMM|nr:glycosyltransferase family 39 protein [Legionella massiliensis]CDZ78634.1 Undecaprenyl phosphate-alpha-4-amino-4-deoxy-L-arabinose arabinosyl transferase [Legionella massiliensis]CEE14372.1 Undecaprenyl phosphate-alpha-4-amino-4-deoxy-L-arabinose arabinosyl transferase [Legionella massiliensis]
MPVIDRDEAHFAQASRQMIQTGNYFQIRFQDRTRFQKPPGINWLQAISVKLFSNAELNSIWPYRLPSLIGALISVLLTYFFARRFINDTAACLASGLLVCTLLLVVEAHMAVIDTSLLSSVLIMQGALWVIYQEAMEKRQAHWGWALCFWLAMAYGLVLKGVTPLVGLLSVVTLGLTERRIDWLRGLHIVSGFLLFSLLSLSWVLLVNHAEHSNYLMQMIHKDLLPKLRGGHESHGKPPLFHLVILPLTFWPASLFLWQGGVYAFRNRHSQLVKFLLAWILPTWIFFELMPTKLPQYVLPTFPAIALLCALAITKSDKTEMPGKWLGLLQILWAVLSVGLALALASLPYLLMGQWTGTGIILLVEITLLTFAAVYFARRGLYQRASRTVMLLALISYPLIFTSLLPQLKPLWLTANLAKLVAKDKISNQKPLLVVGFDEPSLVFHLNTKQVQFVNAPTAKQIIQTDPSRIAVIKAADFETWQNEPVDLAILARSKGFNYSKGKWVELFIVGRNNGEN